MTKEQFCEVIGGSITDGCIYVPVGNDLIYVEISEDWDSVILAGCNIRLEIPFRNTDEIKAAILLFRGMMAMFDA